MAFGEKEVSSESVLRKKYNPSGLLSLYGVTKPVAKRILEYVFGDKFISITPNKGKRKFDVFIDDSVSDSIYNKFTESWKDVFDIYRSNNKKKTR